MKKNILSIILFLVFTTQTHSHIEHYAIINSLEYELFRNNKSIGYHNYKFERKNKILTVKSDIKFKIKKLGINLYKYDAISEEVYEQDQLIEFINVKVLRLKLILVTVLIVVAIIAIPVIGWPGGRFKFLKHALEWDYFLGVLTFYLLTYIMWKKKN